MQHHGYTLVAGVKARSPCVQRVVYQLVGCSPSPLRCHPRLPALNKQEADQYNDGLCCTEIQCAVIDDYTTACLQSAREQMSKDVLAGIHCCAVCHDPTTLSP